MFRIIAMLFLLQASAFAGDVPESAYLRTWCAAHAGQPEVHLADGSRVDCLTQSHAVEMDFCHKWAEAVGQSLFYSQQTGRRAGIVLILDKRLGQKHLWRLLSTIRSAGLDIDVWTMEAE